MMSQCVGIDALFTTEEQVFESDEIVESSEMTESRTEYVVSFEDKYSITQMQHYCSGLEEQLKFQEKLIAENDVQSASLTAENKILKEEGFMLNLKICDLEKTLTSLRQERDELNSALEEEISKNDKLVEAEDKYLALIQEKKNLVQRLNKKEKDIEGLRFSLEEEKKNSSAFEQSLFIMDEEFTRCREYINILKARVQDLNNFNADKLEKRDEKWKEIDYPKIFGPVADCIQLTGRLICHLTKNFTLTTKKAKTGPKSILGKTTLETPLDNYYSTCTLNESLESELSKARFWLPNDEPLLDADIESDTNLTAGQENSVKSASQQVDQKIQHILVTLVKSFRLSPRVAKTLAVFIAMLFYFNVIGMPTFEFSLRVGDNFHLAIEKA